MSNRLFFSIQSFFHVTKREFRLVVIASGLFLMSALAYLWPNVEFTNLAYEFEEQKHLNQELLHENTLLKLERDSLQTLDRVQYIAKKRLKMQEPLPGQTVTIFIK